MLGINETNIGRLIFIIIGMFILFSIFKSCGSDSNEDFVDVDSAQSAQSAQGTNIDSYEDSAGENIEHNSVPEDSLADNGYIYLKDLSYTDSSDDRAFNFYDTVKDNMGTTYGNGLGGTIQGQSWQEYRLDGTYSEMRGRVVLNYDVRTQTNDDVFLWIYGDGIILYMSQAVTAGCEPQDFVIDISGINTLKVVIEGEYMLRLVDCVLYEESNLPPISTAVYPEKSSQSRIYLSDMDWINASESTGGLAYYTAVKDNLGITYGNGLGGTIQGPSWQEYRLDGVYSEMRGRTVLNYDVRTQTNDDVFLWIYGDGELLYQSQAVTAGCEPQDFVIDISGVTILKVVIQGEYMLRLVDCVLYKESDLPTISTAVYPEGNSQSRIYLSDLDWSNASASSGGFAYYTVVKDNFGITYGNGLGGTTQEQSWQEYRLDGAYSEIQGRVVLNYDVRTQTNEDIYLWIYGDGVLLYQSQAVAADCEPQDFVIDISGVTTLKVVIRGENMLRLVDCILSK